MTGPSPRSVFGPRAAIPRTDRSPGATTPRSFPTARRFCSHRLPAARPLSTRSPATHPDLRFRLTADIRYPQRCHLGPRHYPYSQRCQLPNQRWHAKPVHQLVHRRRHRLDPGHGAKPRDRLYRQLLDAVSTDHRGQPRQRRNHHRRGLVPRRFRRVCKRYGCGELHILFLLRRPYRYHEPAAPHHERPQGRGR